MKYQTENEFLHFKYDEAQIADVEVLSDAFHICLDNVLILPENSCNRDIRTMRCNGLILRFRPMEVKSIIKEGYRYYNADGKLTREDPDEELGADRLSEILKVMPEGYVVSFQNEDGYILTFDGTDESTYVLSIACDSDLEEWDRFLALDNF